MNLMKNVLIIDMKNIIKLILFSVFVTSCASAPATMPVVSKDELQSASASLTKAMDVNIVEFSPGLSSDPAKNERDGIWPELRRAESRLFASKLKDSFTETNRFGDVNLVSSDKMLSDIVITGKIIKSNGEDLILEVSAADSSGKKFISNKKYSHRTTEYFFRDLRNKGVDPFSPVYDNILLDVLKYLNTQDLPKMKTTTDLRFAKSLNPEYFDSALTKTRNGSLEPNFIPDDQDELYLKAMNVKIQDNIFKSEMQSSYDTFLASMEESYGVWREASFLASKKQREAEARAQAAAVAGILIGIAGAAASADSYDGYNYNAGQDIAGTIAMAAGAALIYESIASSDEAEVHAETIEEVSKSFDSEVAPKVIEFEDVTLSLEGTISEQFDQWQKILQRYYYSSLKEGSDIVIKT